MDMQSVLHTVTEVEQLENHVELLHGHIVIEEKTTTTHNIAVTHIATAIRNYLTSKTATCHVFTENVALYCSELCDDENNYFLPDVMVVCDKEGIQEDGVHTPPLFVAEITSDSTRGNDYNDKMIIYRNIGVKEYWIVDIQKNTIIKYLSSNQWIPELFLHPEVMKVSVYPELMIDVSDIM